MNAIVIRYKPRAFVSLFIFGLLVTTLFVWLYIDRVSNQPKGTTDIVRSVYMGLCVACGLLTIRAFINMVSKKPVMVINNDGIIDYINLQGTLIHWGTVKKAEVIRSGMNQVLAVYVEDPHALTGDLRKTQKRMAEAKTKKTGTPVTIPIVLCDMDIQETLDLINTRSGAAQPGHTQP